MGTRRMKVFAVLLLATLAMDHYPTLYPEAEVQTETSEWRQFYKFAVGKAMESCLGKDTVNKYTVNMKKAVAKCQQQEAPELDLPPYRSMYKFVNTIIKSADEMDQFKFEMMKMMKDMMKDNRYSDSFNQHDMMKMMKNVFGNEYSNNHYDMMEKFFKNDNDMDAFEMMKMM